MSALRERESVPPEGRPINSEFDLTIGRVEADKIRLVEQALDKGVYNELTPRQQEILEIRGYLGEGPLRRFKRVGDQELNTLGISYQAACKTEEKAFARLEILVGEKKIIRPLELRRLQRQFIVENQHLSTEEIVVWLKLSEGTISNWRKKLGIQAPPVGRPRKRVTA